MEEAPAVDKQWQLTQVNNYQLPQMIKKYQQVSIMKTLRGNKFILRAKDNASNCQVYYYDPPSLTLLLDQNILEISCFVNNDKLIAFSYQTNHYNGYSNILEIFKQTNYNGNPEFKSSFRQPHYQRNLIFFKVHQRLTVGSFNQGWSKICIYRFNESIQKVQYYAVEIDMQIFCIIQLKHQSYYSIMGYRQITICKLKLKSSRLVFKQVRQIIMNVTQIYDCQIYSAEEVAKMIGNNKQLKYGVNHKQQNMIKNDLTFHIDNKTNYKNIYIEKDDICDIYLDDRVQHIGFSLKFWLQKYTKDQIPLDNFQVQKCPATQHFPRLQVSSLFNSIKLFEFIKQEDSSIEGGMIIMKELKIHEKKAND